MKRFRDTEAWKYIRTLFQICLIVVAVMLILLLWNALMRTVNAEDLTTGYVICQPDDFVNIRKSPKKKSDIIGWFETGEEVFLDGKEKNGYLHIVNTGLEVNEGWVSSLHVVFDEPASVECIATIVSNGRLAARNGVDGKRTRWLKPMASVKVHYWSNEWCVTNCGYIRSEYLELPNDVLSLCER